MIQQRSFDLVLQPRLKLTRADTQRQSATALRRGRANRTGFTLLEMLLSLGLSLTLLTILFTALDLHWRFSNQGQTEVERAQIARAVLNKMAIDIRSVTYMPEETTDSDTETGDGTEDTTSTTAVVAYSDPATAFAGDSLGVFGDNQTLILHILKPVRQTMNDPDNANPYERSSVRSVSYFLAGADGELQQLVGDRLAGSTINTDIQGLVRMSGDRFTLVQADADGDTETMAAYAKLLAAEIVEVSFEYHDGFDWLTEWDSEVEQRVPNAIAITIGFKEPDYQPNAINKESPSAMTKQYRLVVPIGVANPFEAMAL